MRLSPARTIRKDSFVVAVALVLAACRPSRDDAPAPSRNQVSEHDAAGAEAPLETATIEAEEVQILPQERSRQTSEAPADRGRPCGWSSAWLKPGVPNPFLAGVGGTPMPTKIFDVDVELPVSRAERSGEIVAEIVIGPDGHVFELTIVRSLEPRWPEAEEAFARAARQWRYEPPRMGRTPISLCTTILITP